LLFLDEPTDGLDPLGRIFVRDLLVQLRDAGKTVFLNSHLLSEIELVCDRIVILDKGLLACTTTPSEFASGAGDYVIRFDSSDEAVLRRILDVARSLIAAATLQEQTLRFRPKDVNQLNDLLDALRGIRASIVSVEPVKLSLEQFFIQVVGEKES
jgi:ABC-2 type transport system ATP-binding protein